ncbi:hypothetical protein PoB_006567000 [Plakobranchus ocellatus]|uniref:Uncharacterized protein n=1 Tax=Plakobranchus ocellatus TaxID=259542 RepID=A0AAV4D595_9GAST|nr:hypothetical protein PoB_006567000 [Plakobranchus ocellatus]
MKDSSEIYEYFKLSSTSSHNTTFSFVISRINRVKNQESLLPWLTSPNSSSLATTAHNMAAMLFVPKNRQVQGGRKEGSAVGRQSALAVIY